MSARRALLAAVLLLAAACEDGKKLEAPTTPLHVTTLQVAGRAVQVELALDTESRTRGLMHRTHLGEDEGMLFIFPADDDRVRNFWMKNTLIPLDIGFLRTDGTLINVGHGQPGVEQPGVWSDAPARMVLELNEGWYARHGFKPGDRIEVPREILDAAH